MIRLSFYLVASISAALALLITDDPVAIGLLSGIATALLIPIIDLAISNARYLRLAASLARRPDTSIRISASYLIRIERGGKYLLIRGGRYPNQFQPVGGVYKYHPSAGALLQQWGARGDDLIPKDSVSSGDLRIRVSARSVLKVVRWFESGKNREIGVWREFYEELVQPGLLPFEPFKHIACDFIGRRIEPMRYSEYAQAYELLIADIFELLPTVEQGPLLDELQKNEQSHSDHLVWVDAERIKRRGAVPGVPQHYEIPVTAEWIL
jgi:hypothetical protein